MARKHVRGLLAACSVAVSGLLSMPLAHAAFELDGNVTVGSGEDWKGVNAMTPGPGLTGVLPDPAPQTIFTGGGSKDYLDLSGPFSGAGGWKNKSGGVPDKDDITNAYAVAYNVTNATGGKELVIYAGADRFDNSGDAFIGFWFFQNRIGVSGGAFTGVHKKGDTLVLANFSGGGTTVKIEVLEWVESGGNVNGTLQRIAGVEGGTPALCTGGVLNGNFCGITNTGSGESPSPVWSYLSKSGTTTFPVATFFELGINITKVFAQANAGATPCFASFLAETRSASSVSAVLKDFVLGDFDVCSIGVTKSCVSGELTAGANPPTFTYQIQGQVQNTGFGTLTQVTLADTPVSTTPSYFTCSNGLPTNTPAANYGGTLNAGESVCYKASFVSALNGASDSMKVTASTGAGTVEDSAGATCDQVALPDISVTKACAVVLDPVPPRLEIKVNVSGSVCNTGNVALSGVSLTDDPALDTISGLTGTLAVAECQNYTGSYHPSFAENRLALTTSTTIPGLAMFTDTATARGSFNGIQKTATATASCNLCPTCETDACTAGQCTGQARKLDSSNLLRNKRR